MHFTQDARVGGTWRGMLRPDKNNPHTQEDFWQGGVFKEITPPERASYTFAQSGFTSEAKRMTSDHLTASQKPPWDNQGSYFATVG